MSISVLLVYLAGLWEIMEGLNLNPLFVTITTSIFSPDCVLDISIPPPPSPSQLLFF
jgi:hypothetical protein